MTFGALSLLASSIGVVLLALYLGWCRGRSEEHRRHIREEERAEARRVLMLRWTQAINPSYRAPVSCDTAEILTDRMRSDLNQALKLLRQARREWTPDQGPSDPWLKAAFTLLHEARGEWTDPGTGKS